VKCRPGRVFPLCSIPRPKPSLADVNESGPDILVVDDHPDLGWVMVRLLTLGGYRAAHAKDGPSALRKIRDARPGMVLLDIMMPGMNGLDVLRAVRADAELRDLPVVVYSALDDPATRREALSLNANGYVVKGRIDAESLRTLVAEHIPDRGPAKAGAAASGAGREGPSGAGLA
jgi:CheY-like chemotaxis protein